MLVYYISLLFDLSFNAVSKTIEGFKLMESNNPW